MTQGFQAQPQQQQFAPTQGYAPPAPPQYQQGAGNPAGGFWQQQDPHIMAQQGPAVPPQPAPQQADTTGFWGGAASISFDDRKGYVKGTFRGGQIISKTISNQTKMGTGEVLTWQDGSPRKQMSVLLQTAERADPQDNGQRQLFIKGDLPRATREAFQAVGASDLSEGGWLYAAWVDEKPAKAAGYNPQKVYKAIYAPPGSPDPLAGQHVPTPQPGQGVDQFAAYAAYQQTGTVPVQPNGAPAQFQPGQQFAQAPGPIAAAPAQQSARIDGMYQQALQMDPTLAAQAAGQNQSQYAPPQPAAAPPGVPADQAAQFAAWQAQQQGGQQTPPGAPPQQPAPDSSGASAQQWRPFS